MRTIGFICLLLPATITLGEEKAKPSEFLGDWEIVSASFNGNDTPAVKGKKLVFDEKEFSTFDGDKKGRTIAFTADVKANPKQLDLERPDGQKAFGIFVIEKGEMKICSAEPGAERPKKFESKEGEKTFLLVLKRMKKG